MFDILCARPLLCVCVFIRLVSFYSWNNRINVPIRMLQMGYCEEEEEKN